MTVGWDFHEKVPDEPKEERVFVNVDLHLFLLVQQSSSLLRVDFVEHIREMYLPLNQLDAWTEDKWENLLERIEEKQMNLHAISCNRCEFHTLASTSSWRILNEVMSIVQWKMEDFH